MHKMRIALLLPSLGGGGAERVFINLARSLNSNNYCVDLVVCSFVGEYVDQVGNINIIDLGSRRIGESVVSLVKYLRNRRPEILLSGLTYTNLVAILSSRIANGSTKVIISEHANMIEFFKVANAKEKILFYLARLLYRSSHGFIGVSNGVYESVHNFIGNSMPINSVVIYNPIISIEEEILPLRKPKKNLAKEDKYIIVAAGRLNKQKDFATIIRAFALLPINSACLLYIYGDGPLLSVLRDLSSELDVADKVLFPGFVNNLQEKLKQADLFVLSSPSEGFGNVLVEALASGCPIVSTNCPSGPHEILDGGRFGILTPVHDENAMSSAIQDSLEGKGPHYNTLEAIAPYRSEFVVMRYIEFFNKCINE